MTSPSFSNIPAHVPPHLVRDVNIYDLPGCADDVHLAWKRLQDESDSALIFSPYIGGHWIATRGAAVWDLYNDNENFSAREGAVPRGSSIYKVVPNESDEPEHKYYRALVTKHLTPRAIGALSESVRALAVELIEGFRPRGECEFVGEFARHLPMTIFLGLVDLPVTDRAYLIELTEKNVRCPDLELRLGAQREMHAYLKKWIDERRVNPGEDLLSTIVHGKVGDRPMNEAEILGEASDVMFGGLDTVANVMGFIASFLATHPVHRQQLIDDPALIPAAVEELLRRHPVASSCRLVVKDCVLQGVHLKVDDMVAVASAVHGVDERIWNDPLEVNFRRNVQKHATFGNGIHRCPGSNLARSELRIFLQEWLQRIPNFSIKPGQRSVGQTGLVSGLLSLPLVWPV